MSEDTNRPRIVMDVCRDGWTRGLQLGIAALDEDGRGDGYRIAGPKYNGSQELLLSTDLDERDAAEIRKYLDRAFPLGDEADRDEATEQRETVRQYGQWLVEIRNALGAESSPQLPGLAADMRAELIEARTEIARLKGEQADGSV